MSGCVCVKHDDLVAENGVLVRLENASDDVFAVCFQICDKWSDISVAVDKEESVDVRELSKSCCVDDLTEVEFAFSLLRKCGKCIVAVFLDELTVVFCSLRGITVEFARCNFADARKLFKSGCEYAERNSDAFDICKNNIFLCVCHKFLLFSQHYDMLRFIFFITKIYCITNLKICLYFFFISFIKK